MSRMVGRPARGPGAARRVTSPLRGFGLTDGNGLAATTVDVRWGDPRRPLVSGGREVVERVLEPPLGLSPSLLGRDHVEDGEAGRRLGRGWPLLRRPGEPREAERCRRRAEGDAVQPIVIEGGRVLEQFARYRGGVQRLHTFGPTVQEGVPPRDALEQRGDGSLVPADHALEGAPRRSSAFVGWPMGHALRGGGAEVELGAVGSGVW